MKKIVSVMLSLLLTSFLASCGIVNNVSSSKNDTIIEANVDDKSISATTATNYRVTIIRKNKEIKLQEDKLEELVEAVEKSLNNNPLMLDLMLSMQEIKSFEETGLSILVKYIDSEKISVGTSDSQINVDEIRILIDGEHEYVKYVSGTNSEVFELQSNSYEEIMSYFD